MLLKDFKDALIEYNGKGTVAFREDWDSVISLSKKDTVITRSYCGGSFISVDRKTTSLEKLVEALEEAALQSEYTRRLYLDVTVKRSFTKEALSKPLSEVVQISSFGSRFIRLLTEEVRNEFFESKTETSTRWVTKKR